MRPAKVLANEFWDGEDVVTDVVISGFLLP